ncbi:hypothetical protein ACJJTC_003535 [Scirpophaga incertulas]
MAWLLTRHQQNQPSGATKAPHPHGVERPAATSKSLNHYSLLLAGFNILFQSDISPPPNGYRDVSPPSDGSANVSPPSNGSANVSPPPKGSANVSPPSNGSANVSPPSYVSEIVSPPSSAK